MTKKSLIIACLIIIIDQLSKIVVSNLLSLNVSIKLISNFFYLTLCHNKGAAFSILSKYPIMIIIISLLAILVILYFLKTFKNNLRNTIAFGLVLGGLLGNLIDRIFLGYVRDFLDFYIFKYDYPVFNIADIAIVIGILLLMFAIIKGEDKSENSSKE